MRLDVDEDRGIYVGDSNFLHIESYHSEVWERYGANTSFSIISVLEKIVESPKYIGLYKRSIEYVKYFPANDEYLKMPVRRTLSGVWYARSLFHVDNDDIEHFVKKGTLKKYKGH